MKPIEVQLSRKKGWRRPDNTVKVDRTTIFGNPFRVTARRTAEQAVADFRFALEYSATGQTGIAPKTKLGKKIKLIHDNLWRLRGKNLACWCPIGSACHRVVLLEKANEV